MSGIHFQQNFISYQEILTTDFSNKDYWGRTLEFCKEYLSGKATFPVVTSGSTGPPKQITLSRTQLQASANKTIQVLGLKSNYNALVCISVDHIGGKMMLVRGMELGMDLYLQQPSTEVKHRKLPKIDFIALVPVQLKNLVESELGGDFLTNCKVTIVGGARLDTLIEQNLDRYPNPIYHTFGMTETASHFALRLLNGPNKQQHYQILPGIQMSLDKRGCLAVKGDITNNKLLITNDLVSIIDNNTFEWLGRKDQVINTGGYKVHPELLQSSIQRILDSSNIKVKHLVTDLPHPKWGQQVVLLLESQPLSKTLEQNLQTQLKQHLKAHEVPKQVKYLDAFPRTDSGKVDVLQIKKLLN